MKRKFFSAVLAAMMLATVSVGSISVSAEEAETEPTTESAEVTSAENEGESSNSEAETTEENTSSISGESGSIDMDTFMELMGEIAGDGTGTLTITQDSSSTDYYNDPYYDTDGNATLIESEQIIYNTQEMQFIAVTTKDGHVFYVLINYTAANGEDNVYFLNKVDDYDLYALLYAGEEDEDGNATITPEEAAQAAEEANGRANGTSGSGGTTAGGNAAEGGESGAEESSQAAQSGANMTSIYLTVGAVAVIGIGAAAFLLVKKKSKNKATSTADVDEDANVEEDEDFEFYGNDDEM